MFEGFTREVVRVAIGGIAVTYGGRGPAVALLHGYPQTHVMWHRVAPALAERFTVVCPDLRGYGDSAKPPGDPEHRTYSKRESARDVLAVMSALGHERFAAVGHDRGARVAHRLARDARERVVKLATLDIIPTREEWSRADQRFAIGTYHWGFMAQPFDLPERLIGSHASFWLRWHLRSWSAGDDAFFAPDAVAEYERCFDPATIHASCEDYRAGATVDLADDAADLDRPLEVPALVLWGARGRRRDVVAAWRPYARDVRGRAIDAGHFLAEERPDEVARELLAFL